MCNALRKLSTVVVQSTWSAARTFFSRFKPACGLRFAGESATVAERTLEICARSRMSRTSFAACARSQSALLARAPALVRPGGHLAFATCSILAEEGPERVAAFLAAHPGWREADRFLALPGPSGDGFFQMVLRRG